MRSHDDTYYNINRLHVIFAVSSALLIAVTVWMFVVDHDRPWKEYQQTYRDRVEPWLAESRLAQQEMAARQEKEAELQVGEFRRSLAARPNETARDLSRMPFVDGLAQTLNVEQIWLPDLTIDYNFRQVARFDRCTTCHQGIDQVEPGTPAQAALPGVEQITLRLAAPDTPPEGEPTLESLYGLALAPRGILVDDQPTISVVAPQSAAAWAGLHAGDAILAINGMATTTRDEAIEALTSPAAWAEPLTLEIRRGMPHPYCGHPRLDLFVGSGSPHPVEQYGCTICHAGQGSATEFKFASHTPNSEEDRKRWAEQYGWFDNKHWDFPMRTDRFVQASCLQCHHDVTDLEPTNRFPDPPAPKLLAGYHLVRQNGCFGCHEISGFDAADNAIGPDMRLEPLVAEAAEQIAAVLGGLDRDEIAAEKVLADPTNPALRKKLIQATENRLAAGELSEEKAGEIQRLLDILSSGGLPPGSQRKVGPSLRHVADRFDGAVLDRWIANPRAVRPTTRMPKFFGLYEHLSGEELEKTKRFEAVEIGAVRTYLLAASQELDLLPTPAEVTEDPSPERGEELFVRRGCVACHRHEDVPEGQSIVGPDLTGLGSMITTDTGRAWLTSWLRDPIYHSPRTRMPNSLLQPLALESDTADGRQRMSDPAADLAAYLLQPGNETAERSQPIDDADLDALARTHLARQFSAVRADAILTEGIPAETAPGGLGDAIELLAPITKEKKLRYIGRRTIRKRGCFGCHDIPGFEGAQPIGPALTDWGRKQQSLLAFEQVRRFLEEQPPTDADGSAEDREFYLRSITAGHREGFLWQKLRQPRSFDFKKTQLKGFNEQLTMGQFDFTPDEREQIMTFVLGLVAAPPAPRYVHSPDRQTKAIADGRKVLDRFGCAECHTMRMPRWRFRYDPEWWEGPIPAETFDFVQPYFAPEAIAASLVRESTGWGQAEVVGRPMVDPSGETILDEDDDGNPLYVFSLWQPAAINGEVWPVGGAQVPISEPHILKRYPAWGGTYASLLYPYVAEEAGAAWLEAWGQVPPALVNEGSLVQPQWLHDYLLNPALIRPSVVLRMPRYNLSPDEASALVDFFAAASGAEYPYTSASREQANPVTEPARAALMDQAMRLVTDETTYCAKCHLIGDYNPGGDTQTILAPNLAEVGQRIRPDYLRRWLADPKSVLPYTGMPVNFPPEGPPMGQDLLPGSSREQLEAVSELLRQYNTYLQQRTSIRTMVDGAGGESRKPEEGSQ